MTQSGDYIEADGIAAGDLEFRANWVSDLRKFATLAAAKEDSTALLTVANVCWSPMAIGTRSYKAAVRSRGFAELAEGVCCAMGFLETCLQDLRKYGAGDGNRTRDQQLGRL